MLRTCQNPNIWCHYLIQIPVGLVLAFASINQSIAVPTSLVEFRNGSLLGNKIIETFITDNLKYPYFNKDPVFDPAQNQGSELEPLIEPNKPILPAEFIGFAEDDPEYPYDTKLVYDDKGKVIDASGLGVSLYYDLALFLKFRPVVEKGRGWGDKLPNGSWTGMPSQMLDPQYDALDNVLCISSSTMVLEKVVDFTFLQPTYSTYYYVHFRPPHSRSFRNVFLQPFHPGVWQAICLVSVLAGITLKFIYYFKDKIDYPRYDDQDECEYEDFKFKSKVKIIQILRRKKQDWEGERPKPSGSSSKLKYQYFDDAVNDSGSFSDLFLWTFSNVCQKGWSVEPQSNSMRIIFFIFILTTTVLYAAYSAVLVSLFSVDEEFIFTDLSQLSSKNIRIYGDEDLPFIFKVIEGSTISTSKSKLNSSTSTIPTSPSDTAPAKHANAMTLKAAVGKVLRTQSAIVTVEGFYSEFRRQNHSLQDYCGNITTMRVMNQRRQAGIYVRKGWKYKEVFGVGMVKIIERGLDFRYNKMSDAISNPSCGPAASASSYSTTIQEIRLTDTITAFILVGIGFGISLTSLCLELTMQYYGKEFRSNKIMLKHLRP